MAASAGVLCLLVAMMVVWTWTNEGRPVQLTARILSPVRERLPSEANDEESSPSSDEGTDVSPRRPELPAPIRGVGARMITLTLLDGTQIALPARDASVESGDQPQGDQLTARDLVEALRATLHGADASEILGENPRWERLMAALLSVLLKKHLVADWEFVDEYSKLG